MDRLGKRLKELRGERSQHQVADEICQKHISITAQTLGRYENGERKPNSEMLTALADYFGVTADYLLGRTDIRTQVFDDRELHTYFDRISACADVVEENVRLLRDLLKTEDRRRE